MLAIAGTLSVMLVAQAPEALAGASRSEQSAACHQMGRPPDPRCNESLDGRAPAPTSPARQVARIVLLPPRLAAHVVLLPVEQATAAVERHQLLPWLHAVSTSDDGKVGVRPEVQYSTSFVPSAGLRLFHRRLPDSLAEISASYKIGSVNVMRGELAVRSSPRFGLALGGVWDRRDDRLFAGIGSPPRGSPPNEEARYRADIQQIEARWQVPGGTPLMLMLRTGFEWRRYGGEQVRGGPSILNTYDPARVPLFGVNRSMLYQRARLALNLMPPARDASGVAFGLDGGIMHGIGTDPSSHARIGADTVASIGGTDRALLLRFMAAVVVPLGSAPVPFDELISPTGAAGIRGLPDGLLRDHSGVAATLEYRWLISSDIDATMWVDEGAVAGDWFAGLQSRDLHASFGMGLRFYAQRSARYWEAQPLQSVQLAYAPGRGIRLILTATPF